MSLQSLGAVASLLVMAAPPLGAAHAAITYSSVSTSGGDSYTGTVIDNFSTIRAPERSYWINGGVNNCAAITGDMTGCNSSIGNPPLVNGSPDNARPAGVTGNFLQVSPGPNPAQYGVGFFQIGGLGGLTSVSFDWGSVDQWNFAQLLDTNGAALITVQGTDLGASFNDGVPVGAGDNRITFNWSSSDPVATLQFGDTFGPAMEVANVTTNSTATVPEPASLALLALGALATCAVARSVRKSSGSMNAA